MNPAAGLPHLDERGAAKNLICGEPCSWAVRRVVRQAQRGARCPQEPPALLVGRGDQMSPRASAYSPHLMHRTNAGASVYFGDCGLRTSDGRPVLVGRGALMTDDAAVWRVLSACLSRCFLLDHLAASSLD